MIIRAVVEDTTDDVNIGAEHGLCLYIKTDRHNILFDTGKTGLFAENALKMGIDIKEIDICVISHGHYDHGGGLQTFLKENTKANIYINMNAFEAHISASGNYIGIDPMLRDEKRLIHTGDHFIIDEELKVFTGNDRQITFRPRTDGLKVMRYGKVLFDDFIDEQYLIINEPGHPKTMITGCSHKGIVNIIKWAGNENIKYVVGGFHFMKVPADAPEGKAYMCEAAEELSDKGITYYTCHCTGKEQYEYNRLHKPGEIKYISSGQEIAI